MKVVLSKNRALPPILERLYAEKRGFQSVDCSSFYHNTPVCYTRYMCNSEWVNWNSPQIRGDHCLVELVESGSYHNLVVVQIPDDVYWHIEMDSLTGQEFVAENYRTWGIEYGKS